MNDGNDWIVDIDLEKFFDTVNHDKLMTIIGRTIKDGDVISIIRKYLVSGIMIDDEYEDSVVGTPQGGNLSPLLANIMLNELDKEMEKRGLNFVRYADDCIIMVGSEMSAKRVMRNISRGFPDSTVTMKILKKIGIERLLIESPGYGHYLVKQKMMDEFFLNLSAVYIGGGDTMTLGKADKGFLAEAHPHTQILSIHMYNDYFAYFRYKFNYDYV